MWAGFHLKTHTSEKVKCKSSRHSTLGIGFQIRMPSTPISRNSLPKPTISKQVQVYKVMVNSHLTNRLFPEVAICQYVKFNFLGLCCDYSLVLSSRAELRYMQSTAKLVGKAASHTHTVTVSLAEETKFITFSLLSRTRSFSVNSWDAWVSMARRAK